MGGYAGLIWGGGMLITIAVLRMRYGRLSSPQSQREEFATYLALLIFVLAFSLTIIRSSEGIARYRNDLAHSVPFKEKFNVLTSDTASGQISSQQSKGKQTASDCLTCHAAKREAFAGLAASITSDSDKLNKAFEKTLAPLQQTATSHARTIALLPKESSNHSIWERVVKWLTPEGRASRALERQAAALSDEKHGIDEKLSAIRTFYGVADYRQETGMHLNRHVDAMQRHDSAWAAYHLLQAAAQNDTFHNRLVKGDSERNKAAWSLFIIDWGCLLFVAAVLGGRILLRSLYPDAKWYIYPGTIFFWGISLLLMTDLGLNYVPLRRFLGYYTWSRLALCFAIFVICTCLCRLAITRNLLAIMVERARYGISKNTGLIVTLTLTAGLGGYFLRDQRIISSELIKAMAVIFFAWYALARGDYLSRRSHVNANAPQGWVRKNIPDLLVVSAATLAAFVMIHDFGPLLSVVILFSCYAWVLMGRRTVLCLVGSWSTAICLVWIFRGYLNKTSMFAHIYRRINEMMSPFHEGSTELAKLVWLRKSAGAFGYGFGKIPYYGHYVKKGTDTIVTSMQLQSDYTASHLIAQFGYLPGFVLLGVYLIWLLKLLQDASAIAGDGTKQAAGRFVGWVLALAILLMVIQVFLTVGGNFTLVPLTGVTLPYISFGGVSLLIATLVSALSYAKERLQ